jgi:hypothetical protein
MEDVGMQKADLLDELRMEIGVASDRTEGECAELYQAVCDLMVEKMGTYEEVCIYLSGEDCFVRTYQCGAFVFPFQVPFGGWKTGQKWRFRFIAATICAGC